MGALPWLVSLALVAHITVAAGSQLYQDPEQTQQAKSQGSNGPRLLQSTSDEKEPIEIVACRCDVTNDCISDPEEISRQTELFFCLATNTSDSRVFDVRELTLSQGSLREESIVLGRKNAVTWVTSNEDLYVIRTRLENAQFFRPTFMGKKRTDVSVSGVAIVLCDDDFRFLGHSRMLDAQVSTFRIDIPVESRRLLSFVKDLNAAVWSSLLLILSLSIFILCYAYECYRQIRIRSGLTSSPTKKRKTEEQNHAEIERIWNEAQIEETGSQETVEIDDQV